MANVYNLRGTSHPSFRIGKGGGNISQGATANDIQINASNQLDLNANGTDIFTGLDTGSTITTVAGNFAFDIDDAAVGFLTFPGVMTTHNDGTRDYANAIINPGTAGIIFNAWQNGATNEDAGLVVDPVNAVLRYNDGVGNITQFGVDVANQAFFGNVQGTTAWVTQIQTNQMSTTLSNGATAAGLTHELRFSEQNSIGTNYVGFKAPDTIATDLIWTLPAADATIAGQVLSSDAAGNLSWVATLGALISDADSDTYIRVEDGVTDNDTIEMRVGPDTSTDYVTTTEIVTIDTTVFRVDALDTQGGSAVNAGAITLNAGASAGTGNGGSVTINGGSGPVAGAINITGGASTGTLSGDVNITGGTGGTAGGSIVLTPGDGAARGSILIAPIDAAFTGPLRFQELAANGSSSVGFQAPGALAATTLFTLPAGDGTNGQSLQTDGATILGWGSAADYIYEVYDSSSQAVDGTATVVGFDTERFANANFSVAAGVVTCNVAGTYTIEYSVSSDSSNGTRDTPICEIHINGSATAYVGSDSYSYNRNTANGEGTNTKKVTAILGAGDTVEVRIRLLAGAGCNTIANSSNLIIERKGP